MLSAQGGTDGSGFANSVRTPSGLDDAALFQVLTDWFALDRTHSQEWRKQAAEDFKFVAHEQWSEEDRRILEAQGRPVITFNRTLPMLKSVAGIEINSRHETAFVPRIAEDGEQVAANETLSAASKWMDDNCDAEDEQSESFQDCLICGIGCTESRIAFDEDWMGLYVQDRVYPLEMYWDRDARKKNLVDSRRFFRLRKMTLGQARDFIEGLGVQGAADEDLNADWASGSDTSTQGPRPVEVRRDREENAAPFDPRATVYLVHAQWVETQAYFKMADPETGGLVDIEASRHEALQAAAKAAGLPGLRSVPIQRKVWKEAFLGSRVLLVKDCANRAGPTFHFITGDRNSEKGLWFGIVASLRDPQMWANKWLSQTLHILNSTAKGGILAESDAFPDIREAQETYARPDHITEVAPKAISQNKIMPKPGGGFTAGYQQMLEFAISSIRDTTGLNMELLGLRDAEQPGILEAQRKQAAMTILATTFDSLRRFRKLVGRCKLSFIQDYFSNGRLIRIKGADGVMKGMRLLKDKTAGEYEIVVEDAPTSPTQKEQTFAAIQQLMPLFAPFIQQNPELALIILEYSPLPSQILERMRQLVQQSQQSPQAMIAQQSAMLAPEKTKAEINEKNARAAHAAAQAEQLHSGTALELIRNAGALSGPVAALPGPEAGPDGQRQAF